VCGFACVGLQGKRHGGRLLETEMECVCLMTCGVCEMEYVCLMTCGVCEMEYVCLMTYVVSVLKAVRTHGWSTFAL